MIPLHKVNIAQDAITSISLTLHSGMITEAERVKEFEARLSAYFETPVLATNSCTSAIDLALHLCGVGSGDHVVATPMTCVATTTHVTLRGAKLIWADIDSRTGNIDPHSVAARVTPKTKAILIVDWAGRPCDCRLIRGLLPRPVPIIQDAAHSFGARFEDGEKAHSGSRYGDYVCWSFQAIKHLTTGDGGALKVPPEQFDRARRLRWFGIDRDTKAKFRFLQDIPEAGYKYHMNDLTAALGLANFDAAVTSVSRHRENAALLGQLLNRCKNITIAPPSTGSSWWFFSILTPHWERFVEFSAERGVQSGPVHGRNDAYSAHGKSSCPLPGVDCYSSNHVAVPCGWWLTRPDLKQIADTVIEWDAQL